MIICDRSAMKRFFPALISAAAILAPAGDGFAQRKPFERLPAEQFDATPPSALVAGSPGEMRVRSTACRNLPTGETRRRIVDVAAQEWGFFGFSIVDYTVETPRGARSRYRWWRRRVDPREGARTAATIAGYWAATPRGTWMIDRQNGRWNGSDGLAARWRDPWSAAFVSWVMCEGGLGSADRFQRSIAHHVYVDQAIRARDAASSPAAFTAHDVGATAVEPLPLREGAYLRMNVDIGNQSRGGAQAVVLGNIANSRSCEQPRRWERKSFQSRTTPEPVSVSPGGLAWLLFGVDSGFGARTQIYFTQASVTFTPL